MPVPKASVQEDYFSSRGEDKVGLSWQLTIVLAIPVAQLMNGASNTQLKFRVD
jgi:hypothetical protein